MGTDIDLNQEVDRLFNKDIKSLTPGDMLAQLDRLARSFGDEGTRQVISNLHQRVRMVPVVCSPCVYGNDNTCVRCHSHRDPG